MRIGTGAVLLVLGAILYAAVDVDVPHVNDNAVGLIVLLGGLVMVVIAAITRIDRPDVGVSAGLLLIAAGAILSVAVRVELPHVAVYVLGSTLICAGVIILIATAGTTIGRRIRRGRRTGNARFVERPETGRIPSLPPDLAVISDKDAKKARRVDPP
jgi:peptidoglycan/LPS O-acetylase OafA/YrhL